MTIGKIFKKIAKIIWVLLLLLFVFLVGFYFAIQSPKVQTFLAQKITKAVSNTIGTAVEIGNVEVEFFNTVKLNDFLVRDLNKDTLIFFNKASAELNYFSMFSKNIDLDEIAIDGLYVNIYRPSTDTLFNFSFLGKEKKSVTKDTTEVDPWFLNLSTLNLSRCNVNFKDSLTGAILEAKVPNLITHVNALDLQKKTVQIEDIILEQPNVLFTQLENLKPDDGEKFFLEIPLLLLAKNVRVKQGDFNFVNTKDTNQYKYMEYNNLNFNEINLDLENVYMFNDSLNVSISSLSLEEKSGLAIENLSSKLALNNKQILIHDLNLSTNNSQVNAAVEFKYRFFADFKNFAQAVRFQSKLKNTVIDPKDLQYFSDFEKLGINGVFKITGEINGRVSSLRAKDVILKAGKNTAFRGNFSMNGLPNIKETFISLRTEKLITNYRDLKYIYNKLILPPNASKLGTVVFKGKFDGFYSDFVTYGEVSTDLGFVNTDINFKMSPDGKPSYSGIVNAKEFQVGKWFDLEDQIGKVSLSAQVKGSGVKLATLDVALDGNIEEITLRGYTYENIDLDGSLKNKFFEGNALIDDDNLKVKFNGLVDARKAVPVYDFTADLTKINLLALNLAKQDYTLSGYLKSNFTASSIDDVLGQLAIDSFNIAYAGKNYKLAHLSLKSIDKGYEKQLELKADNLDLKIAGKYQISQLPKAAKHIFIPSDTASHTSQLLRIDAEITDNTELISLFVPKLKIPEKILVSANLNTDSESLLASISIPKLKYNNIKAVDFSANILVKNGKIDMIHSLPEVFLKDSILVKDISIIANGTKDDLDFNINGINKNDNTGITLLGNLTYAQSLFNLRLDTNSTILINNSFWNLSEKNLIRFNNKSFTATDFKIYNKKSEANFKVNQTNGTNNLVVNLKKINVEDFAQLLREKGIDLKGVLNGEIKIDNFDKEPAINGDLSMLNILVNDYLVGDFKIDSRVDVPDKKVYLSGGLYSKENHIDINGMYSFDKISTKKDFDIDVNIKQFTVKSLEDFIPHFINNSAGTVNGNLKLIGSRKKPNLNGYVDVNDVTTTVSYTQVPYTIAKTRAMFVNNEIRLADKVVVQDNEGNVAFGSGKITHTNFRDWALDIKIVTEKIKALNTTINENEDFYGTAYIKGGASFTGITNEPLVYIYGESEAESFLDVPLTEGINSKEFQFYKFISQKSTAAKADEEKENEGVKVMGAKIKLDLNLDEDLELKIILDQDAGDVLKVKGTGNVKIDVGQKAEFVNFFGSYNVSKGDYLFTMQNIINKPFRIEPNSKINFNGDIYKEATIDMSATYSRKVALDDFVSEYISNSDEDLKMIAKNRVPVTLFLDLSEKLSEPTITFDIGIDRVDPKIQSIVDSKLQSLKLSDSEMNNQIFGVLVLSRFIPTNTSLENSLTGSSLSDAAVNTVTEFISSQFSRYLTDFSSSLVKDLEFYVNFSSYDDLSEESLRTRRELQLALSKRFFNDRLIINVGGDFDFGENYDAQNSNTSTFFGGNVSFEYAVTKNRRWRIKAFTISDFDNFNENNRATRTGLGFSYKREFDDVYDLFNIKRKTKNANTKD